MSIDTRIEKIEKSINALNNAKTGTKKADQLNEQISSDIKALNLLIKNDLYVRLTSGSNCGNETALLIDAIKERYVDHYYTREVNDVDDEGEKLSTTHIELAHKEKYIDIDDFYKFLTSNKVAPWAYKVSKLNELLCLKTAIDLGYSENQVKQVAQSYFLSKKAQEINMGGTPTSKTEVTKLLQDLIDTIIYVDNGEKLNKYKVINKDVEYVLNGYTRCKDLKVLVGKDKVLKQLLIDVMYRLITNTYYSIGGFRVVK